MMKKIFPQGPLAINHVPENVNFHLSLISQYWKLICPKYFVTLFYVNIRKLSVTYCCVVKQQSFVDTAILLVSRPKLGSVQILRNCAGGGRGGLDLWNDSLLRGV